MPEIDPQELLMETLKAMPKDTDKPWGFHFDVGVSDTLVYFLFTLSFLSLAAAVILGLLAANSAIVLPVWVPFVLLAFAAAFACAAGVMYADCRQDSKEAFNKLFGKK